MKKSLKISTYCLVVSIIIAIGLCYIIIPERTKCAFDIVVEYLNKPLGIVFGTTITLGLVVGVVLKLVFDKHRDSVRQDINSYKAQIREEKAKFESVKHELTLKETEIKTLLGSYKDYTDNLEELLVEVCETSPNAKIKAIGEKVKSCKSGFEKELEEKKDIVDKYEEDEIKTLLDKITSLEKKVESYEREETIND